MNSAPPVYHGVIAAAISILPVVVAVLLVRHRLANRLETATVLVVWGLAIVVVEHAAFGISEFGGTDVLRHGGFHFQMLAAYGIVALMLAGVIVAPLIRRGVRLGWLGLLVLFVMGVGAEVATAVVATPHGVPPRFWSWGLFLWGYPVAWGAALALSHRPIFGDHTVGRALTQPLLEPSVDTR